MVVRMLGVLLLTAIQSACGQELTLALYDVSWKGEHPSLTNERIVDSTIVAEDEPSFHPTEGSILYVRKRGTAFELVSYDAEQTEDSLLYSGDEPASHLRFIGDNQGYSFLAGSKGQLHKLSGERTRLLLEGDPIVDYEWIDGNSLFVVRRSEKHNLEMVTLRPPRSVVVARHVGSNIARSAAAFAFVHKLSVDTWAIKRIGRDGKIAIVGETLPRSEAFAISPEEKILMLDEGRMFSLVPPHRFELVEPAGTPWDRKIKSAGIDASGTKLFVLFAAP